MSSKAASSRFAGIILIQLLIVDLLFIGILVQKIKEPDLKTDHQGKALSGIHMGYGTAMPGALSVEKPVWVLKPLPPDEKDVSNSVILPIPAFSDLQRDAAGRFSFSDNENRAMVMFNLDRHQQEFIATAYDLSFECCGKYPGDPEYGITFTGRAAQKGRTIAVDPSVIPLGSQVYICFSPEYAGLEGWYTAEDTGSKVKGNTLDIFFGPDAYQEAKRFGRQKVKIIVLSPGEGTGNQRIRKAIGEQLSVKNEEG